MDLRQKIRQIQESSSASVKLLNQLKQLMTIQRLSIPKKIDVRSQYALVNAVLCILSYRTLNLRSA